MPAFEANGITINYERSGHGPPLLLVMGLGGTLASWHGLVPLLEPYFDLIRFDNRGAGGSSMPTDSADYSMQIMAADALAVLDYLGLERAHVFGVSMGGMIAQHLVLNAPERVERLILGCTYTGGEQATVAEEWVLNLLMAGGAKPAEAAMRDSVQFNFAADFAARNPGIIEEYVAVAIANRVPPHAGMGQLAAIAGHDSYARLNTITAPTLIQHGDADILVPFANAAILAGRIPNAELEIFPGAGHVYFLEQPQAVAESVLRFLKPQ